MLFKRKMADKIPERKTSYADSYRKRNDSSFGKVIKDDINKGKVSSVSKDRISSEAKAFESAAEDSRFATENNNNNNNNNKAEDNPIQREFKKLERDGEKAIHEFERIVVSRKARKIEKWIIAIIYVVVLGIALYFILATFFPDYVPNANSYEIKAGDSKIFSALSSFYVDDQSVLGDKVKLDSGDIVRSIVSSKKFNFVFAPKENIPAGRSAVFELNLFLNKDKPGNIYVNDNLIFPDLTNYVLVKETPSDYVYVNKEILPYVGKGNSADGIDISLSVNGQNGSSDENNLYTSERTEDFIYKNLPGASVWATRKLEGVDVKLDDYKKEWTKINTTIRDSLRLAVYAEGELSVDFVKQDLNVNIGEDTYNVTIKNSDGDILFNQLYEDDGDNLDSNKIGKEQNFSIRLNNLKNNIYYVSFIRDDNNKWEDSTLKNIQINSNKVLILGTFLLWDKWEFYTKVNYPFNEFKYSISWSNKKIINLTGSKNQEIIINKDNQPKVLTLDKGEYFFKDDSGKVWIFNNYFLSQNKNNWFDIPLLQQSKFDNPNVIIIDKYNFDKSTGFLTYIQDVDPSQKKTSISLRTLNSNSIEFKNAKMILK